MVTDPAVRFPLRRDPLGRIARVTRREEGLGVDAGALCEQLFGDRQPANLLLVGAAYQHGCLPLSAEALEQAIRLNGVAVERNLAAFRWGRAAAADPDAVAQALGGTAGARPATGNPPAAPGAASQDDRVATPDASSTGALDAAPSPPLAPPSPRAAEIVASLHVDGELRRLLELRVPDLLDYQDEAYARRYARAVADVAAIERERCGGASAGTAPSGTAANGAAGSGVATAAAGALPVAEAYARGLHKLMAYKDEYEVARLHLDAVERARREAAFGEGARVRVMLHPPLLRALGMQRKLALGRSATPLLRTLARSKRLRGTALDPFGRTQMRRLERALIGEYDALVQRALKRLDPTTAPLVAELAALPELVRGYESVKLRNVARFRARAAELIEQLERAPELLPRSTNVGLAMTAR
jgi:indolepyruvate ferredoxin oxidoreductase